MIMKKTKRMTLWTDSCAKRDVDTLKKPSKIKSSIVQGRMILNKPE